jgi:hypothetical protein
MIARLLLWSLGFLVTVIISSQLNMAYGARRPHRKLHKVDHVASHEEEDAGPVLGLRGDVIAWAKSRGNEFGVGDRWWNCHASYIKEIKVLRVAGLLANTACPTFPDFWPRFPLPVLSSSPNFPSHSHPHFVPLFPPYPSPLSLCISPTECR